MMTMIQFKFLIVAFLPSATFAAVYDDRDKVGIPLLSKVQALGLTTAIAKQKVLSGAEKAKLFSKLEKQKAFSSAEKLLPTVDKLGLLQFAQETIDTSAGESFVKGVGLVALAPIYAALVKEGFFATGPAAGERRACTSRPLDSYNWCWCIAHRRLQPHWAAAGPKGRGSEQHPLIKKIGGFEDFDHNLRFEVT